MPVSAGSALSSCVNASSPPAEAPTPTIGNDTPSLRSSNSSFSIASVVIGVTSSRIIVHQANSSSSS